MPPESPKLPDEMIATLKKWIEGGVIENAGRTAKASKEMENGGQVKNWAAHGGGALSVEFTRDSRLFSSGRDDPAASG